MTAFGYPVGAGGLCVGVSHMGIVAMLTREVAEFDEAYLQIKIFITRQMQDALRQLRIHESFEDPFLIASRLTESEKKVLLGLVRNNISALENDAKNKKTIINMKAFLDDVSISLFPRLNQNDFLSGERLPSARYLFQLINSEKLQKEGGVSVVDQFSGIYSLGDLIEYVKSLSEMLEKFPYPVAFALGNMNHSISISYDFDVENPEKKVWTLVNANNLKSLIFTKESTCELAHEVMNSFFIPTEFHQQSLVGYGCVAFLTHVYVSKCHEDLFVKSFLEKWHTSNSYNNIHTVTKQKAVLRDLNQNAWIQFAIELGDVEKVKELLEHEADPNALKQFGGSLVTLAINNRHEEIARLLLKFKADPNIDMPLRVAVQQNNPDMMQTLLDYGADPDGLENHYPSPLIQAVEQSNAEAVETLLEAKARVNVMLPSGISLLHFAVQIGDADIVAKLLKHEALPDAITLSGESVMSWTVRLNRIDLVSLLLEYGASVDLVGAGGIVPLQFAFDHEQYSLAKLLLKKGADPTLFDRKPVSEVNYTPLHAAINSHDKELVSTVLEKGVDVNRLDVKGNTPLFKAVGDGDVSIVQILLDAGADTTQKIKFHEKYMDVFELARFLKNTEMSNFLDDYLKEKFSSVLQDDSDKKN